MAGSALVVGTSGRDARGAWTARDFGERAAEASRGGDVSVVFGPEASGLAGRELDLCHRLVHVPTAPAHPSGTRFPRRVGGGSAERPRWRA